MKLRIPPEVELQDALNAAKAQENTDAGRGSNDIAASSVKGVFYVKSPLLFPLVIFVSFSDSLWGR